MIYKTADDLTDKLVRDLYSLIERSIKEGDGNAHLLYDVRISNGTSSRYAVFKIPVKISRGRVVIDVDRSKEITFKEPTSNRLSALKKDFGYLKTNNREGNLRYVASLIEVLLLEKYGKEKAASPYSPRDSFIEYSTDSGSYILKFTTRVVGRKIIISLAGVSDALEKTASGHHKGNKDGGKEKVPDLVKHIAARLVKEKGYPKDRAFAIAVAHAQRIGAMKKGTMRLTPKGKGLEAKHERDRAAIDLKKVAFEVTPGMTAGSVVGLALAHRWANMIDRELGKDVKFLGIIPRKRPPNPRGMTPYGAAAGILAGGYVGHKVEEKLKKLLGYDEETPGSLPVSYSRY